MSLFENMKVDIKLDSADVKDVANKLFDKFCDGISWLSNKETPQSIAVNDYIQSIQKSNLDPQTKAVLIYSAKRDIKRWVNSIQICNKAIDKLLASSRPEEVDADWADLYRECSGTISTEDAQEIWAIILAQECNEPGSMPKALLNTMLSMGKQEAEAFTHLASFCLTIDGERYPLIIQNRINDYYNNYGLGLGSLHRLETLGLINFDHSEIGAFGLKVHGSEIGYFDEHTTLADIDMEKGENTSDSVISIGVVTLSFIGEALIKIIVPDKVEGFFGDVALPYLKNPTKYIQDMLKGAES